MGLVNLHLRARRRQCREQRDAVTARWFGGDTDMATKIKAMIAILTDDWGSVDTLMETMTTVPGYFYLGTETQVADSRLIWSISELEPGWVVLTLQGEDGIERRFLVERPEKYVGASKSRGYSAVRLPWVMK